MKLKQSAIIHVSVLAIFLCSFTQAKAALQSRQFSQAAARRLHQAGGVRVADFTSLLAHPFDDIELVVGESQLSATINLTSSDGGKSSSGSYVLAPSQVQQLDEAVLGQLRTIPPSESTPTTVIPHPGVTIRGSSFASGPGSERSLPTVFAPFHAGTVFRMEEHATARGTTLHFANMTLLMPNVTFNGIYESGFLDFFDIGDTALVCFTNSILVLESCDGFAESTYHMWCCTTYECNDFFTQQKLAALGHHDGSMQNLEYIQCYAYAFDWGALSSGDHTALSSSVSAAGGSMHAGLLVAVAATAIATVLAGW